MGQRRVPVAETGVRFFGEKRGLGERDLGMRGQLAALSSLIFSGGGKGPKL